MLETGNNSEPIELGDNHLIVLRILDHEMAETQPLESVKDKVTEELRDVKAREITAGRGNALLKELKSGKSLAEIASAEKLELKTTGLIGRNAAEPDSRIVSEAFLRPSAADKAQAVTGFALDSGDYVLLQLEEIQDGDMSKLSQADQLNVRNELERIIGATEVTAYTDELKNRASIIIPEQAAEQAD